MCFRRPAIAYREDDFAPCNWPAERIEAYAGRVLRNVDLGGHVTDLAEVLERYGGSCHYLDDDALGADDGTIYVHGPCDFDVILPVYTSQKRDRFTVAHELGHYFLHSNQGSVPLIAYRLPRHVHSRAEWEATMFANALLLPAAEVRAALDSGMDLAGLSATFEVPAEAVAIRVRGL
jgi:hypothetical protein